jgi:hypothetical protein
VSFVLPSNYRIRQSKEFEQAFRHKGLIKKWFTIHLVNSNHEFVGLHGKSSKRTMAKSVE